MTDLEIERQVKKIAIEKGIRFGFDSRKKGVNIVEAPFTTKEEAIEFIKSCGFTLKNFKTTKVDYKTVSSFTIVE